MMPWLVVAVEVADVAAVAGHILAVAVVGRTPVAVEAEATPGLLPVVRQQ